jgi:short-subunit dehydrogenase
MKTVLITGSTSGFGKGLVTQLLAEGYKVIATGRNLLDRKDIFATERQKYASRLIEMNLDMTSLEDLRSIEKYFFSNPLDILINNAGYGAFGPIEENLRHQFEVNVFGLIFLTQKLLPPLRNSKGHILNLSSVLGLVGFPLAGAYCATKYAIEGFSESLSYELKPFGIKVTLIEPGGYPTNFSNAVQWVAKDSSQNSIYAKQVKKYAQLRDKLANRKNAPNPNDVVQGISKIVKLKNPKLNYSFGKDAFVLRLVKKIMPRSLFHRLTSLFF